MALSKKTRFEVFKRDSFCCQYCGSTPPKVVLEVDHINPVSKGGTDDIDNLITSCFDCNRGKSNNELTSIPDTLSSRIEILKEKDKQIKEYEKLLASREERLIEQSYEIGEVYETYFDEYYLKESFMRSSVKKFIKELGYNDVEEAMHLACSKIHYSEEKAISYFCGICWNKIREK